MAISASDSARHAPVPSLDVGIVDWIDVSPGDPADLYQRHLRVVEFADPAGFERYHVAEHHDTPRGMAASPNVFLAAAVRTRRVRLGLLVTLPPVFHPLRQLEETTMFDQLSRWTAPGRTSSTVPSPSATSTTTPHSRRICAVTLGLILARREAGRGSVRASPKEWTVG